MTTHYLNYIDATVPEHDANDVFVIFSAQQLNGPRQQARPRQLGCAITFGPQLTAGIIPFNGF